LANGKVNQTLRVCFSVPEFVCLSVFAVFFAVNLIPSFQFPSPVRLEDLSTDVPISASSKAKAKQAVQSRAFAVPAVRSQCNFCPTSANYLL
jgi:hypothetical protein